MIIQSTAATDKRHDALVGQCNEEGGLILNVIKLEGFGDLGER